MRMSQMLLPTLKEVPNDASLISHQLMLRAGMIRQLASGLYTWLPLGLRILRKVEAIVREEMNASGAQELLMPSVQPGELWQESGRWQEYGPELLRFKDRHQRDFCYGPTHEEVISDLARNELNSYKQLPMNLYQIQTKFRDEIRPRFGVMRAREFIMKDGYSFHIDGECLEETYQIMYQTYCRIFTRLGLDFRAVQADSGSIGGSKSHEFQVLADSGEDAVVFSDSSEFAVNIEKAEALPSLEGPTAPNETLTEVATPGVQTISELCTTLQIDPARTIKTLLVEGAEQDTPLVALALRGDHQLNEIKAAHIPEVKSPLTLANKELIIQKLGCPPGSLGPIGLKEHSIPVIVDHSASKMADFVVGSNKEGFHTTGTNWQRDVSYDKTADIRNVVAGDPSPDGKGKLLIKQGIEVGHIFQLGSKYSEALQVKVLDDQGKATTLMMGCYGIGVSRIIAAAIEQNHTKHGITWPKALAPFQIALLPLKMEKSAPVKEAVEKLYSELTYAGYEVLLDDRKASPGIKFKDSELIGIAHRVVISDKSLTDNLVEYREVAGNTTVKVNLNDMLNYIKTKI